MPRTIHTATLRVAAFAAAVMISSLTIGCSLQFGSAKDTSTTASPATSLLTTSTRPPARSVTVQGVTVASGAGGARGEPTDMTVTVAPSGSGRVAVGVIEGEVFGTGPQWRVAAWSAALAASNLLSVDLADYRITYEVAGRIDGPSAGALLTVATLAALLGDEVRTDVTMTGSINPDYTVGPVGGIPHKVEAAAKADKTRLLIPMGQQMDLDENLGVWVDVMEVGRIAGVETVEVGDVFEAYESITGRRLPEPRVVVKEPRLSDAAHEILREQALSWIDSCTEQLDVFAGLPDSVKSDYEQGRVDYALESLQQAGDLVRRGLPGAAVGSAAEAARQALLAVDYATIEQSIQRDGEYQAGIALYDADVTGSLDVLMDELLAVEPTNVSEAVALVGAWGYWTVAGRLAYEADWWLEDLPADGSVDEDERLDRIYTAVFDYALAAVARDSAYDALALGRVLRGEPIRGQERLTELAETYRRVAEANLDTVQVVVMPGLAEEWGMTEDEAYDTLLTEDVNLAEAEAAVGDQYFLMDNLSAGPSRDYAILGAALVGYAGSAASMAEHYSYGAQYDDDGEIGGFDNEKALADALDFARDRGKKLIALASRGRADTALPVMYFQAAELSRDGYPGDKINALYGYWMAAMYAQIMAVLAGDLEPLAPR